MFVITQGYGTPQLIATQGYGSSNAPAAVFGVPAVYAAGVFLPGVHAPGSRA